METLDAFKPTPMSKYDPLSRPKSSFNNIRGVSLSDIQSRIVPRQVASGTTRGTQLIGGKYVIQDKVNDTEGWYGIMPDGRLALAITKEGFTIEEAITAD